jgi:hypothetical protein
MDWKTFVAGVLGAVVGGVGIVATGWFSWFRCNDACWGRAVTMVLPALLLTRRY